MALTVIAGFSTQLLMGRSTFASPLRVHVHAVLFMGWVALGWIGLVLAAAMVVIVAMARNGTVPFFFTPQHFLLADPLTLVCFVGLTAGAIALRRQTDWHARPNTEILTVPG